MPFSFDTSLAFPLIKLNTLITYTKVKKPTGVGYFLLVLINEMGDKKTKISDILVSFGIPLDLHDIFENELLKLIQQDIIVSKLNYHPDYFDQYTLGDFGFTPKGKKIFLEEAIPLNQNEETKVEIFYNPAKATLDTQIEQQHGSSVTSFLNDEFFSHISVPEVDEIEEFLNQRKGVGLPVKKEEVILDVKVLNTENRYVTYPVSFLISDQDELSIDFHDQKLNLFALEHYNHKMIGDGLKAKRKFQFLNQTDCFSKISDWFPIHQLMIPEEFAQILSKKSQVDICSADVQQTNHVISYKQNNILSKINTAVTLVRFIDLHQVFAYVPTIIQTKHDHFGIVEINMVIEKKLENDVIESLLLEISQLHNEFIASHDDERSYSKLIYLAKAMNMPEIVIKKISEWLAGSYEEKVILLNAIKEQSTNYQPVYDYLKTTGFKLYGQYIQVVDFDEIPAFISQTAWIRTANKIKDTDFLADLFSQNQGIKSFDQESLFTMLEEIGFRPNDILVHIPDMIPSLLQCRIPKGKLTEIIILLNNSLENLVSITEISNPLNYALKADMDRERFLSQFPVFRDQLKTLSFLDELKPNVLENYRRFLQVFTHLFEIFSIESRAINSPESISRRLVEKKINDGDILSAVTLLYVKLSSLFKNKFKIDGNLDELINKVFSQNIVNQEEADLLHRFRRFRNDILHANLQVRSISNDELIKASQIIFRLEEDVI